VNVHIETHLDKNRKFIAEAMDTDTQTSLHKTAPWDSCREAVYAAQTWLFHTDHLWTGHVSYSGDPVNPNPYEKQALSTESYNLNDVNHRMRPPTVMRLIHAALGLSTESAEFADAVKKHLFYGKPLDSINLIEELGDLFWYAAIAADTLGVSFSDIQQRNIEKLARRYPAGFTPDKAIHRDLKQEREALSPAIHNTAHADDDVLIELGQGDGRRVITGNDL